MSRGKQDDTFPHKLMVYGTLMRGNGNDRIFTQYGGKYIGPCTTKDKYVLAGRGVPFVWEVPEAERETFEDYMGHVRGELWRASDEALAACDRLEGHPTWYKRTDVTVQTTPGAFCTVGLYIVQHYPGAGNLLIPNKKGILQWARDTG